MYCYQYTKCRHAHTITLHAIRVRIDQLQVNTEKVPILRIYMQLCVVFVNRENLGILLHWSKRNTMAFETPSRRWNKIQLTLLIVSVRGKETGYS